MPDGALTGRVAVVTGARGGIGRSIATGLVSAGAIVCGIVRVPGDLDDLDDLERTANGGPGRLIAYDADLASESQCHSVAERILRDQPRIDVLVHAAGVIELAPLATATAEEFDRQYQVNVRAPFALTQAFLDSLVEQRGQVVFLNSTAGLRAAAGVGQYAATKHALRAVADSFRDEVNELGVRVSSVYVGRTATPMQARVHAHEGRAFQPDRLLQPGDVASLVMAILVLPRTAEVTDVSIRPHRRPA